MIDVVAPNAGEATEAIDTVERTLAGAVGRIPARAQAAVGTLRAFVEHVRDYGPTDLEWGEPGECHERLTTSSSYRLDRSYQALLGVANADGLVGPAWDEVVAYAVRHDLGRHYGDPHCIFCLKAQ